MENNKASTVDSGRPQESKRPARSRRKGNLSQIMVLFNGIVLTLTSFVALLIFVQQMQEESLQKLSDVFKQNLTVQLQNIESYVDNIALFYGVNDERISAFSIYPNLQKSFTDVAIVEKKSKNQWKILTLRSTENTAEKPFIRQHFPDLTKSITQKTDTVFTSLKSKTGTTDHMAIIKRVIPNDNKPTNRQFVIAIVDPHAIHAAFNQSFYEDILRYRLFHNQSGHQILNQSKVNESLAGRDDVMFGTYKINMNDVVFDLVLDTQIPKQFILINKLPILLLVFGTILTLIGTIYVRSNFKQSSQLSLMNETLEAKNNKLKETIERTKNLYNALRQSENEYKTVVNAIQDVLFEIDIYGKIIFVNDNLQKFTKIPTENALGENISRFFSPEDKKNIQDLVADFKVKDHGRDCLTATLLGKDKEQRSVEIHLSVMRTDENTNEKRIIGTICDVEDRKQAEHALVEVEKKYSTIVENASTGIYQVNMDGSIRSANPAFAHILGYTDVESMMEKIKNIKTLYCDQNDRKIYEDIIEKDSAIRLQESQIFRKDGSKIWISDNARSVLLGDGSLSYYEGTIEDITIRKQAENDLIAAKLNSDLASRAKSEFLANMSHELRTPLNAIIGFSEIIKGEALGEITQRPYVDYARDIYESGSRLLNVINEILGISKIEAGERQLNESLVHIDKILATCIDLLASKIETSQIEINNNLREGLPAVVAEELAFKQIFMNLLSNAIKFTPSGGRITLDVEYTKNNDDMRISITDTGIGIEENDIPKVLSPFGQINNTLSRNNAGTGLGLTLVDSLIRLHGGDLELVSKKNIGTTVTIIVPSSRVSVNKVEKTDDEQSNVKNFAAYKNKE